MKKSPLTPTSPHVYRLLIVDNHPLDRFAFRTILEREADLRIAAEADDVTKALPMLGQGTWNGVVVELFPGQDYGLELIKNIHTVYPKLPILAVSHWYDDDQIHRVFMAGAMGFWHKSEPIETIPTALRKLLAGEKYVSQEIAARLYTRHMGSADQNHMEIGSLSDRELEVYEHAGQGYSAAESGKRLNLSENTVGTHRSRIKIKLGLRTIAELISHAGQRLTNRSRRDRDTSQVDSAKPGPTQELRDAWKGKR